MSKFVVGSVLDVCVKRLWQRLCRWFVVMVSVNVCVKVCVKGCVGWLCERWQQGCDSVRYC